MLTTRDLAVIDFINEYKVASTSTIAEVFFPSKISCYRRLQVLSEHELKRIRDNINSEYIYYKKLPKQMRHSLLVSDFYRELYKKSEIINFKIEPVMGNIRPDAVFGYTYHTKTYLGLLEVEISNKGFNYNKYEKFYSSGDYKNYLPVMPTVFIIGNKIKLPEKSEIKYIIISTDFNNLKL
jgi:hypothetical protein